MAIGGPKCGSKEERECRHRKDGACIQGDTGSDYLGENDHQTVTKLHQPT